MLVLMGLPMRWCLGQDQHWILTPTDRGSHTLPLMITLSHTPCSHTTVTYTHWSYIYHTEVIMIMVLATDGGQGVGRAWQAAEDV